MLSNVLSAMNPSLLNKLFDIKLVHTEDFLELFIRLLFNLLIVFILVRMIYRNDRKGKNYSFAFIAISMIVFLICFLLESVKLELGFALGLFAIFGILRYRTETIPIKEMTYLFVVIGISVINALANKKISYAELFFANAFVVGLLYYLEVNPYFNKEQRMTIKYERIDLIVPERYEEMLEDLRLRTGLPVKRFAVKNVNFLRDTADVYIFYENIQEKV
ncbi:MAG: DUF4956 domain-containing protein [Bacteroidales bacterium]|nr:DUF4956 domain-containing protein [Bacteroidales bacterium]MDD3012015.1 DUF4956 domain-containing protein [Bacteroidales bacterium]MDD3962316.1 DUF4956 domain-containing protein [Bacteroidales bacterium]